MLLSPFFPYPLHAKPSLMHPPSSPCDVPLTHHRTSHEGRWLLWDKYCNRLKQEVVPDGPGQQNARAVLGWGFQPGMGVLRWQTNTSGWWAAMEA